MSSPPNPASASVSSSSASSPSQGIDLPQIPASRDNPPLMSGGPLLDSPIVRTLDLTSHPWPVDAFLRAQISAGDILLALAQRLNGIEFLVDLPSNVDAVARYNALVAACNHYFIPPIAVDLYLPGEVNRALVEQWSAQAPILRIASRPFRVLPPAPVNAVVVANAASSSLSSAVIHPSSPAPAVPAIVPAASGANSQGNVSSSPASSSSPAPAPAAAPLPNNFFSSMAQRVTNTSLRDQTLRFVFRTMREYSPGLLSSAARVQQQLDNLPDAHSQLAQSLLTIQQVSLAHASLTTGPASSRMLTINPLAPATSMTFSDFVSAFLLGFVPIICEGNRDRYLDHMRALSQWFALRSRGYSDMYVIQYAERAREMAMTLAANGAPYTLAYDGPSGADSALLNEASEILNAHRPAPRHLPNPSSTGQSGTASERVACKNFAKTGTCSYGDRCKFAHIPGSQSSSAAGASADQSSSAPTENQDPKSEAGQKKFQKRKRDK